ncbi:MAG: putative baseplate assembly protein [Alphaproteobacteria bacterium]|nr:putative baseplate assembly protein [Alphaproteobacteria bacterium]MCB9929453.1 putative baseplate assembly protein [Alphaproteobacteria bacterium]
MSTPYLCDDDDRRRAVRAAGTINGIDFLEVADASQTVLDVTFLHPLPGEAGAVPAASPALTADNVRLSGGVRITPVRVLAVARPQPNVLRVTVDQPGDFSPYTLSLVAGADVSVPPPGFDPTLSAVAFSFKAACPTDLPCAPLPGGQPLPGEGPAIDYLAKDYDSFRSLMLARLRQLMPDWRDASIADPFIGAVETLAYAADRLSYMQDAAAGEAYLATARSRISVRRHARLVGYTMHEGCNARTFVAFDVLAAADGHTVRAGTPVVSQVPGLPADIGSDAYQTALQGGAEAFATLADVTVFANHDHIAFHTWSRRDCCLPKGSTAATLSGSPTLSLAVGDYLLLIQTAGPETGAAADADPAMAHVVRITSVVPGSDPLDGAAVVAVAWGREDALPFDLPLEGAVGTDGADMALAEARGNIAPADHGAWVAAALEPDLVPLEDAYRPCVSLPDVTFAAPFRAAGTSAAAVLRTDPREAAPELRLSDPTGDWTFQHDLLASDRFANDVVAEVDEAGFALLRFGDDINGRRPTPLNRFAVTARVGNGTRGNVGRNVLAHAVTAWDGGPAVPGIRGVSNPLPGQGGVDRERVAEARLFAPPSIRTQQRAVTEADWAEWALRHPEVQRASAELRWTGSWYTVFVTVDRVGGGSAVDDAEFRDAILAHLARGRLAGYDLELRDPIYAPLRLELRICVARDHAKAAVRAALLDRFSAGIRHDGSKGFFHPDRFSFGDPVFSSRIYREAMAVDGVGSAEIVTFQRVGQAANGEIAAGVLRPGDREIVQLDNDPNFPERGTFDAIMEGSL